MYRLLLVCVTVGVLIVTGLISGRWTYRWTNYDEAQIDDAANKVYRVPLTVGRWSGSDVVESKSTLPEEIVGRNIIRNYVNQNNGMAVTLFLTCGPTRPMWYGHLPTECYPGAGYKLCGSTYKQMLSLGAEAVPASFQVATFSMADEASTVPLRVFWSWSGDGNWQVPDNPNKTFAHYPYLYKIYIIRRLLKEDEPVDGDPCMEFAKVLLPELKKSMF
jgi:hypothetical protein